MPDGLALENNHWFGPEDIAGLTTAFEAALAKLGLVDRSDPTTLTLAKLLSQWRGYNGAIGYAIGFNADWLQQNADAQGFQLVQARYEPEEQQQTIVEAFNFLKASLKEEAGQNPPWEIVKKKWWPRMLLRMAALKDKHFKEEKEWRLVKAKSGWEQGISTRPGPSGLIPYLPVKLNAKAKNHLSPEAKNIGIERIIVGPGLSARQTTAVDALLASHHMRGPEIRPSSIPYIPNK